MTLSEDTSLLRGGSGSFPFEGLMSGQEAGEWDLPGEVQMPRDASRRPMPWAAAWQLPLSQLQWALQGCPITALSPHCQHLFLHAEPLCDLQLDNQVLGGCFYWQPLFLRATTVTCRQVPSQFHDPCLSLLPAPCLSRTELCREGGR